MLSTMVLALMHMFSIMVVVVPIVPVCSSASFAWTPHSFGTSKTAASIKNDPAVPKVSGHGCCNHDEDTILLFGGLLEDRTATNDLWILDNKTEGERLVWRKVSPGMSFSDNASTSSVGPGPRMYAPMASLHGSAFVIGGWDPEEKGSGGSFKEEVWKFDLETLSWERCDDLPCGPISRHTAVTVRDKIIIHTYKTGNEGLLVLQSDGTSKVQATLGKAPVGLSMCAVAAAHNSNEMVLFGGSTKTQQMSNDLFILNTKSWTWTKLSSKGDVPPPQTSSCMAHLHGSTYVVFGGASLKPEGYDGGRGLLGSDRTYMVTISSDGIADWKLLNDDDEGSKLTPRPRVAASLNRLSDNDDNNKALLLIGGWDPATAQTFDDAYTFHV